MFMKFSIVFCFTIVVCLASEKKQANISVTSDDQKSITKRGIYNLGALGHPYGGLHYTPPAIPLYGKPFPLQPFQIAHGGAAVTSYSSNFPQYPYQQRPSQHIPFVVPKPTFVPAVYPSSFNHLYGSQFPNFNPYFGFAPQKPIIPIAVPVPSLLKPKIPLLGPNIVPINFQGAFNGIQPQFVQIPVPHHNHIPSKDCAHTVQPTPGNIVQYNNQWQPIMSPTSSSLIAYNQQKASAAQYHQNHHQNQYPLTAETFQNLNYEPQSSQYNGPSSYET